MSAINSISDEKLIEGLIALCVEAGEVILDVRDGHGLGVSVKDDESPVTIADQRAETLILKGLAELAPDCPVVAEEAVAAGNIPKTDGDFFLVDPLDGTKEFIKGGEDFTVNIGLIRDRKPVLGVVYAPAKKRLYVGCGDSALAGDVDCRADGEFALDPISVRKPGAALAAVASRSHRTQETNDFLDDLGVSDDNIVSAGSSLKFCLVAEGKADVYPRLGRTMEWDTAAGHAVLIGAGGIVTRTDGTRLLYDKRDQADDSDFANPHFVAYGAPAPITGAASTQAE